MSVEIINYKHESSGSLIGTFSVKFNSFKGFVIHDFRHSSKNGKTWIDFPLKFQKNEDGSWAKPEPRCHFSEADDNFALKRILMEQLAKIKPIEKKQIGLPF